MRRLLLFILLLSAQAPGNADQLGVSDAWIRNLPMVVPVRAGYLNIINENDHAVVIEAITSNAFEKIEIHKTMQKDGMMGMQHQDRLTIPARQSMQLQPGGMHLMMTGPTTPQKPGDTATVVLHYADSTTQSIIMKVRP